MRRTLGIAALIAAAAATMITTPASAAPGLSWHGVDSGSLSAPGLGVVLPSISMSVENSLGSALGPNRYSRPFAPRVKWSARVFGGQGRDIPCRVDITFLGTSLPTYHATVCEGSATFTDPFYNKPGTFTITAYENMSGMGARDSRTFVIQ
ncbi:hypothetical protein [Gordonia sp. C13]|uniref:hypothetical protein n=1 Tax=Gordonia sp. C13 TaxID=2935078 RepID=UPI00200A8754|nr:hypothetical protein [Gordonia sp. C13]MCK8613384.1 hypothetical protein [Gordonia sp. C13]